MFSKGLDDSSCRDILHNCLKILQTKVKDLASLAKDRQIKGENQLKGLKKYVEYLIQKFDSYEEDRKRKDDRIKSSREEVTSLHTKLEPVQIMVDKQEQYSRWNFLLIHGLEEKKNESTDDLVFETNNTE